MATDELKKEEANSTLLFVKEVGKYFMDFLETDFHKRRLPRRNIKLHDDKGLLSAINISKYPTFNKLITKLVSQNFDTALLKKIEKGVFKADIPLSLQKLISLQIKKIDSKVVKKLTQELSESLELIADKHSKDYTLAFDTFTEHAQVLIKKIFVIDLVKSIEESLLNAKLGDENTLFQMEEELTELIWRGLTDKSAELLKSVISKEKVNLTKEFRDLLEPEEIQVSLVRFFEMFKVADLFSELHELYRNFKTQEKQEFYLYLFDISYEKNKYPIFYIPFSLERKEDVLHIEFDAQLYINKKALSFIAQEFNIATNKKGSLTGIEERIIYLADHQEDLELFLQEQLTAIVNFFALGNKIDITNPNVQACKSLMVNVTSSKYISLFDKSDEALINDYEKILNAGEDSPLMTVFQTLIDDFIHKNPQKLDLEVSTEWDDQEVADKLVYQSPIPLNSEQLNIVSALKKDGSKYVLVEGPPGTGKSHTITAIAFNAILNNRSVLILSDKKEALDVVEKNIVNTMNKVRLDNKFQNPILRLGKTGNNYGQILAQSSIDNITEQFKAVRQNPDSITSGIDESMEGMKTDISEQIEVYNKVTLDAVKEYALLEKYFEDNEPIINLQEFISSNSESDLVNLRQALVNVSNKCNVDPIDIDASVNLNESDVENCKSLISIVNAIKEFKIQNEQVFESDILKEYLQVALEYRPDHEVLQDYLNKYTSIVEELKSRKDFFKLINAKKLDFENINVLRSLVSSVLELNIAIEKVKSVAGGSIKDINLLGTIDSDNAEHLQAYINEATKLGSGILGFFGKKKQISELNKSFNKIFPFTTVNEPHKNLTKLKNIQDILDYIKELSGNLDADIFGNLDILGLMHNILADAELFYSPNQIEELRVLVEGIEQLNLQDQDWFTKKDISEFQEVYYIAAYDEYYDLWDSFINIYAEHSDLFNDHLGDVTSSKFYDSLLNIELSKLEDITTKTLDAVNIIYDSEDELRIINKFVDDYPETAKKIGLNANSLLSLINNNLITISDLEFDKLITFIGLNEELSGYFESISPLHYGDRMKAIEEIVTTKMSYLMDERFITFTQNYSADARALKAVIKSKKEFPQEQFSKLKDAFPCILAGIRDYAEYIPLEPEIFDLVIIDEASQVSIAQAFPALVRAKKVIVLGDNQQFSNVKSSLAKTDLNQGYVNSLREVFEKHISTESTQLARLEKFNIKVSILDFFEFINNYKIRLVKHFRGYKENISYSNRYFYNGSLQVMKIRGKAMNDVLKFTILEHDGKQEIERNTNSIEIDFIVDELKKLKDNGAVCSVGIITPHTNQQLLLEKKIREVSGSDYFYDTLDLKVMTFDTCQGEERDIIYYSMVATENDDKLTYIFISDLNNINQEDDAEGKIKAQRLNVGLSRSKECMHFVLSKPVEKFTGSIGQALKHYKETLEEGVKEVGVDKVDPKSPMEPMVLNWFHQTKFWTENKHQAEIIPQFELGKYLKQLDKTYNHPSYVVDFLLIYNEAEGKQTKVVIEYDGLIEHFGVGGDVNASNYTHYYSENDLYRQHVLEGYGYKFIRLNKFNTRGNPIESFDQFLTDTFQKKNFRSEVLNEVHSTIKGLQNQSLRECPKCNTVRDAKDFADRSLASGVGRFCKHCKNIKNFGRRTSGVVTSVDRIHSISKSDVNKLENFTKEPEKYATGTRRVKEKISYLETLREYMSGLQKKQFDEALSIYHDTLNTKASFKASQDETRITAILEEAIKNHHIVTITYKGFERDIFPYSTDGKYCVAYCTISNELRTFRVDRMENVHASGMYNFDNNLEVEAREKLTTAPTFRGNKGYRRF